ncbi:MAG: phospholipase D-like domain-containing protein [Bacteroidota bacterium]
MSKKKKPILSIAFSDLLLFGLAAGSTFVIDKHVHPIKNRQTVEHKVNSPQIDLRFSPKGGCTDLICQAINGAQDTIYINAYSFTSEPIATALFNAQKRGVKVHLIVDHKEHQRGKVPFAEAFKAQFTYFTIDPRSGKNHPKYMVIDKKHLITGSFNFDENAEEKNRENVAYLQNVPKTAKKHLDNWQQNKKKIIAKQNKR